jgi:hypothetical protein
MLYKVFIDESGSKDYLNPYSREFIDQPPIFRKYPKFWWDNYFVLCAIRIKQEDIGKINSHINALKIEYFGTHRVEVKSDWLRNSYQRKKRYLVPYKIGVEKLNNFGESFIDLITQHKREMKLFAVVFDKRFYGDAKRKTTTGHPLLKTVQILFERIQYAGNFNVLVFDQMESSLRLTHGDHAKILNIYRKNEGLNEIYVDKYDRIVDVQFKKSAMENFLQVADICSYNIYRQFLEFGRAWSGMERNKDGKATMGVYKYFDRIRCNFAFHPLAPNQVRGIGLSCLPDGEKLNWDLLKGCFEVLEDKIK